MKPSSSRVGRIVSNRGPHDSLRVLSLLQVLPGFGSKKHAGTSHQYLVRSELLGRPGIARGRWSHLWRGTARVLHGSGPRPSEGRPRRASRPGHRDVIGTVPWTSPFGAMRRLASAWEHWAGTGDAYPKTVRRRVALGLNAEHRVFGIGGEQDAIDAPIRVVPEYLVKLDLDAQRNQTASRPLRTSKRLVQAYRIGRPPCGRGAACRSGSRVRRGPRPRRGCCGAGGAA